MDYQGTLLVVSHDRAFINNVVTSTLVFEGEGVVREYVGGYDDWLSQCPKHSDPPKPAPQKAQAPSKAKPVSRPNKLGYMQKRELERLPARIEALEAEQEQLSRQMGDPVFYKGAPQEIAAAGSRLKAVEALLEAAFDRWEVLEALKAGGLRGG